MNVSGAATFTGATTFSTVSNLNNIRFVDGTTFTTIQAAIDDLPNSGGIVFVPPGTYDISTALLIGDGTSSAVSTKQHIRVIGAGIGGTDTGSTTQSTRIRWTGSAGGTMVHVRGPIRGVEFGNFFLDANTTNAAASCFHSTHSSEAYYHDLKARRQTGTAIVVDSTTFTPTTDWGKNTSETIWQRISAAGGAGTAWSGLNMDAGDDSAAYGVSRNTFIGFDFGFGTGAGTYGMRFGHTDNNTFIEGLVLGAGGSSGNHFLFVQQTVNTSFPQENIFINVAGSGGGTTFGGISGVGGNWFLPMPTGDGAALPTIANVNAIGYSKTVSGVAETTRFANMNPTLDNDKELRGMTTGGTPKALLNLNPSNQVELGNAGQNLRVMAAITLANVAGDSWGTTSNPFDINAQDLNVGQGVAADGGGFKHAAVSTGSVGAGARADVVITWATAFVDTNYTPIVSMVETSAAGTGIIIERIRVRTASAITVQVLNESAGSLTGGVQAIAVHD